MLQKMAVMAIALVAPLGLQAQRGFGGPGFGGPGMGFGMGPRGGGVVLNQPYSDVESSTSTESFVGGTQVIHQSQEQKWRDAQGRTRTEVAPIKNGQPPVFHRAEIFDPVAHTITSLDLDRKLAIVRHLPERKGLGGPGAGRGRGPGGPGPQGAQARKLHTPPGVTVTTTDLAGKSFAGVFATGKQVIRTVAAGTEGNTNALVNTSQRYVDPILKIVLYSSDTNQLRNSVHEVTTLNQTDPNASLFQVPAGFTVRNAPQRGGRPGWGGPGGRGPGAPGGE